MEKLKLCESVESALTLSEAETTAEKEAREIENIRRAKLQTEAKRITDQFSTSGGETDQSMSPIKKRKRGQRALLLRTPQQSTEQTTTKSPALTSMSGK